MGTVAGIGYRCPGPAASTCRCWSWGERDRIFSVPEIQRTARAYRTTAEIVPGMGHDMMIEPGWEAVADRVSEFATRK